MADSFSSPLGKFEVEIVSGNDDIALVSSVEIDFMELARLGGELSEEELKSGLEEIGIELIGTYSIADVSSDEVAILLEDTELYVSEQLIYP